MPTEEAGKGTCSGEKSVGNGEYIHAGGAGAYEHGEEFAVGEGGGAKAFETFLGSFMGR